MRQLRQIPHFASPLHDGVVFEPAAGEIQLIVSIVDYYGPSLELAAGATDTSACLAG